MTTEISELQRRLKQAEAAIEALKSGEVDAVVGKEGIAMLRLREIEEALRESERFSTKVLDADLSGIYIFDVDQGLPVFINRSYTRITGHTLEELRNRGPEKFFELFHPEERERVTAHIETMRGATDHEIVDLENRFRMADGHWIWCISRNAVFSRHEDGTVREIIGSFVDITQRKRMEAELEAANRRKDEFLAMLGHELRNPLAAITTALQVARKKAPDAGGDDGWPAEIIERQTEVLRRLVDDLLDVSRITRGKITLNPMPVEIGEHLETAVRSLEQAHDGNVWVTVSTPPEPVFVSADPARLQQVFNNLLTNAVKYSPEGGEIRFSAEIDGGAVMIRCRDQGMGMAPEKIPEIFEPFTQLDTPLHRENAGLGIGLALVKRLVEMHGGSVSAVSEGEGNGTEFRVTLPVIESPAEETPAPAAASVSRRSDIIPRRILLAEDNIDLARSLKTVLEETGHTVELVHDGPAAVSAARNNPPDAAVIDIGLPGLDGYKVAGTIREEADGAAPLLIGTSGYARDPARSSGPFDHYLVKPINIDALLGHIDALRGSAETETAPGPAPADGPLRVLLIEDHPALGTLMLMELRNHGYEAKLAKSGEKGIETAAEFLPHIVLCDLRLPGMNGPEVAGKLREMAATRPAFLVALTADRVEDQMDRLTAAGFDHAVTKPLEAQTLDRLVAEHRTAAGT